MAHKTEKEETDFKVPETITLCVNNCGVTGNPATNNMCQNCFAAFTASTSATSATSAAAGARSGASDSPDSGAGAASFSAAYGCGHLVGQYECCPPHRFVEDVLVQVGELIFPANYYVLNMEEGFSHGSAPIILGKPFLKIAQTKIDVYDGTLSMEFGDIVVHFNILDAMKFLSEDHSHSVFRAELIDDLVDENIHDFDSFHDKKHSFLSDLYSCLSCIESESAFRSDFDCDDASGFDTLGVVPLGLDFIELEYTTML
uniref:Zinc finger A20 and AN1 domain-containing stress-associated protein 1 n=1 Tax=Cajanus cajan TaxID=3821 RepID=A0A151SK52_CAJCA|nr:Zinc finger A20 and AN1 domain-containing stress-associated protein 1 [Cajanus cajan]